MMLHRILRGIAPVAALAASAMLAGCDTHISIGDNNGVPLAELDLSGEAPTELAVVGPDNVVVTTGNKLDIDVSGDQAAVDALRFSLEDGALGISRERDSGKDLGKATVRVTMPSLTALTVAGSGSVEVAEVTGTAEVTIAGSGSAKIAKVEASTLDLTIAGSGDVEAAGTVEKLDMTIAGSGSGRMAGLAVQTADISVVGSGSTEFSSDGKVDANIMGSGSVTVNGAASCTVSAMGSGKLNCRAGETRKADGAPPAPKAPKAPNAPAAPEAPEA